MQIGSFACYRLLISKLSEALFDKELQLLAAMSFKDRDTRDSFTANFMGMLGLFIRASMPLASTGLLMHVISATLLGSITRGK